MEFPSVQVVYSLLSGTLEANEARKQAEQQLLALEQDTRYCTALAEIITNPSAESHVRIAGILCFKNAVIRHWRRRNGGIPDDVKASLRVHLVQYLLTSSHELPQHAMQIAVLISYIARIDFPQHWPDLLERLLEAVQSATGDLGQHRAFLLLYHVVNALCSKRLMAGREQFSQIAPKMFAIVASYWEDSSNAILQIQSAFSKNEATKEQLQAFIRPAETCKLSLKTLNILVNHGIHEFHKNAAVLECLNQMQNKMQVFIQCKKQVASNPLSNHVDKLLTLQAKSIVQTQKAHPSSFGPLLQGYLPFFGEMMATFAESPADEALDIQCMFFLKNVVECGEYQEGPLKEITGTFFSNEMLLHICKLIVGQIFPMNASQLEDWESNPEDFYQEEDDDSWQDKKKPCAENLFLTLIGKFQQTLGPLIAQLLQQLLSDLGDSEQSILLRDACYNAIGLGSWDLYDFISFPAWFSNHLLPLLQSTSTSNPLCAKIIKRRIAWITGRWVSNIPAELKNTVYSMLVNLLIDQDLVVSLTAARTLKILVDDCGFYVEPFLAFLDPTINGLFSLLSRVEECDTKLQILSVVTVMIQQLEQKMAPYTDQMVQHFGTLWKSAEPNEAYNFLKQSIVRALIQLVEHCLVVQNQLSASLYSIVAPIISYSTDVKNKDSIYLLEDGLVLWLQTIVQLPQLDQSMLAIFPHICQSLDTTFEHTKISMRIIEQHLLIGKGEFLQTHVGSLVSVFEKVIGNVKDFPTIWTLKPIDTFIILFPKEAIQCLDNTFQKILKMIFSGQESDLLCVYYISLFARAFVGNQEAVFAIFQRFMQNNPSSGTPHPFYAFLEIWLEKIDSMAEIKMRKLSAISLCNVLCIKDPQILTFLGQIISTAIGSISDTANRDENWIDNVDDDQLTIYGRGASQQVELLKQDPVVSINVKQHFLQKLNDASAVHGAAFQQALQAVDPAILSQLNELTKQ